MIVGNCKGCSAPAYTEGPVSSISVGGGHACAIADLGVFCWGNNDQGQLGNGDPVALSNFPDEPANLPTILGGATAIAAGYEFTCAVGGGSAVAADGAAVFPDGTAFCWGSNSSGQLGNGALGGSSSVPSPVSGLSSGVTGISVSFEGFACAVVNEGVQCWGAVPSGNGGLISLPTPAPVQGLPSGVTAVATGDYHICALANGEVWCWGDGANGQLGNGGTSSSSTPTQVMGLPAGVTAVAAGAASTCVLINGGVQCFGSLDNVDGILANPTPIQGWGSGVTAISLSHSGDICATVSGAAQCFSQSDPGQPSGTQVAGLTSGVTAISAGPSLVFSGGQNCEMPWTSLPPSGSQDCAVVHGNIECWTTGDFTSVRPFNLAGY